MLGRAIFYLLSILFLILNNRISFAGGNQSFFEDNDTEETQAPFQLNAVQNDPLEKFNRKVFVAYQQLDAKVLDPLTTFYIATAPKMFQNGVRNVGSTYSEPITMVNAMLAINAPVVSLSLNRFFMNIFFGFAGLDDVASKVDIEKSRFTFADVLRMLKIPEGPYFISPIGGVPGSLIDGANFMQSTMFSPYDFGGNNFQSLNRIRVSTFVISTRADLDNIIDAARATSVDLYLTQRAFYFANKISTTQNSQREQTEKKQMQIAQGSTFTKQMRISEEYFL